MQTIYLSLTTLGGIAAIISLVWAVKGLIKPVKCEGNLINPFESSPAKFHHKKPITIDKMNAEGMREIFGQK